MNITSEIAEDGIVIEELGQAEAGFCGQGWAVPAFCGQGWAVEG
ncbi:hypothetical protein P3T35_004351 [Kitasatospora sp. GP30]|nr:hypothetical protein [Kitasatospora sp. GP30]MDH6142329.1 hypothetical protein [Kitasatospora sp. GP30]